MTPRYDELELLRFNERLGTTLREVADAPKAFRVALREIRRQFEAERGCIAFLAPGDETARVAFSMPEHDWDPELLTAFLRREHPAIPRTALLAPIRTTRPGGALVALERDRPFVRGDGDALTRVARTVSSCLREIDRDRAREVRSRIDRKIMEELRPKDLFYQILHGIRSLTHYDHSSAMLIAQAGGEVLELVAEQIAWRKGKSSRIGVRLPLDERQRRWLGAGRIHGFDRGPDGWHAWRGPVDSGLAALLDDDVEPERPAGSMLCAALGGRDGFLGVVRVASQHPGAFGPHEVELIRGLLPQVSVAIQNSRRTESLREQILESEKKLAVAALARGVSHDVNNALGSVLPLVQQMRGELERGEADPRQLVADLERVEASLKFSQRIFGGMLAFARGAARQLHEREVARAVHETLAMLGDSLARRAIRVGVDCDPELPPITCRQGDLEQLLLNLLTNARDAMPDGGTLTVRARRVDDGVEIRIRDTGEGIPAEVMARISEPFFSTKEGGSGLGLSICNSIVADMQGELRIDSRPGDGTEIELRLPVTVPAGREEVS